MDELISSYLAALAGCVCEEINEVQETCFCGITVGDQYISMSGTGACEEACGEAWVRITNAFSGSTIGQSDPGLAHCDTGMSLALEVGALRCIEIPEDGEAPTAESLLAASDIQVKDMVAIRKAILCCDHFPDVIMGVWTPRGPEAGLIGGTWTLTVGF